MKGTKKKELLEDIVEMHDGENDISRASFFGLDNLNECRELLQAL